MQSAVQPRQGGMAHPTLRGGAQPLSGSRPGHKILRNGHAESGTKAASS